MTSGGLTSLSISGTVGVFIVVSPDLHYFLLAEQVVSNHSALYRFNINNPEEIVHLYKGPCLYNKIPKNSTSKV